MWTKLNTGKLEILFSLSSSHNGGQIHEIKSDRSS